MRPAPFALAVVLVAGATVAAATATTATLRDLPTRTSQIGSRAPNQVPAPRLKTGVTYRASLFPLAVSVKTPNSTWSGAQGRTLTKGVSPTEQGPFGWVELVQRLGAISIITAYGHTPSVAATVTGLRTRGRGATYEPTSPVKLAGFSGSTFDGQVVGATHYFIPFTPPSGAARFVPDSYELGSGDVFRVIVLDVRGKTVVLFLDGNGSPADQFPVFLTKADQILGSLRFAA